MGYPAELWVFDEGKISQLLRDLKEKSIDEFLEANSSSPNFSNFKRDVDSYLQKDITKYKENKLTHAPFLIQKLIELSGAKLFDLYEFNHFEYNGFWDALEQKQQSENKGFQILKSLLGTDPPKTILNLPILEDTGSVQGYASSQILQESGNDALALLQNLDVSPSNSLLFNHIRGEIDNKVVEAFSNAKTKIINAMEFAIKNKCGIILFTS